ncbi:MAG TPA: MBL fold metallo-hydrolase, partial [Syntrophorhabdaceae bacterium]|nr:MBL fold metallo-hydrolase [Syntrophorhabdaceae bacterium]HOG40004.1 MBL fold metallo-hydrolase [Syntrophorhabdaceae bacterium]
IGGFHLLNESPYRIMQIIKELIQLGVTNIGPCHCTGELAERYFRDLYRDHYVDVFAGQTIEI